MLTIGVLSRRRGHAVQAVESALATVGCDAQVVVAFDDEPLAMLDAIMAFRGRRNVHAVLLPIRHFYVRGMNALYAEMKLLGADRFVVVNDDVFFTTRDWGPYVLEQYAEQFPEGGIMELAGPDLCAHYLSDVRFIDQYCDGKLADMRYTMYFSDTHLMAQAKGLSRYRYVPGPVGRPIVDHRILNDPLREELKYWYAVDQREFDLCHPK